MSAVISPCGKYRYQLGREWDEGDTVLWIMLNPSTADAETDDPTIRRCTAFSKRWGFAAMLVGNLYAFRATQPDALWAMAAQDARGPKNISYLNSMVDYCRLVVCAWGASGGPGVPLSLQQFDRSILRCLGKTKNGAPRHPLYVPQSTILEAYP